MVSTMYPMDTGDFYPIMTAILATKPDVIDLGNSFPPFCASLVEAARTLGFKGTFMNSSYDMPLLLSKVPADYIEGFITGWPETNWDSSLLPEECRWYTKMWQKKYNEPWHVDAGLLYSTARVLGEGMKAADSIDPVKIAKAFEKMDTVAHPTGPAAWTGKEIWGIDHTLLIPTPVYEFRSGETIPVKVYTQIPRPWNYDIKGIAGAEEWLKYRPGGSEF